MKKTILFAILTYLLFAINSISFSQNSNESDLEKGEVLKVGVLLPLSGEFESLGNSFLKSIQLALYDISNKDIKIYPKDSKANPADTLIAAKEFQELGIKIVIGPIFHESLENLDEVNNITFISLTNKTENIPKNAIAFGININSQIEILKKYFNKIELSKTLLLSPKTEFLKQTETIEESKLRFYRVFFYDTNPKKITNEIEKLTLYQERKKDLERRIQILKKSDLYKDKNELKILEQKHTLGEVEFDSVFIIDFDERLKSVLTSFMFSDITTDKVNFFSLNQWFDEKLFNETAVQNLHFPSINLKNLTKFKKRYYKLYNENPNSVSLLAYDALGLIYYCWINNNKQFQSAQLFNKNGFKGLHGEFTIKGNASQQKLKIYKISKKKFLEIF